VAYAFSRLGETSSPERDKLSLKTGARHLSDNSHKQHGRVATNLAYARHARLGEKTRTLHCSCWPTSIFHQSKAQISFTTLYTPHIHQKYETDQKW